MSWTHIDNMLLLGTANSMVGALDLSTVGGMTGAKWSHTAPWQATNGKTRLMMRQGATVDVKGRGQG